MSEGMRVYAELVESALRSVVREILVRLQRDGRRDPHHFYITFRTDHPGVELPDQLRERYPAEMTIVLQHEFWDLDVREHEFVVTLSFNNVRRRLRVPFAAIKIFADPGVNFGLEFRFAEQSTAEPEAEAAPTQALPKPEPARPIPFTAAPNVVALDRFRTPKK
jgi:hypothetical protein